MRASCGNPSRVSPSKKARSSLLVSSPEYNDHSSRSALVTKRDDLAVTNHRILSDSKSRREDVTSQLYRLS